MSALEKITISLPAEMVAEIRAAVEAGEFANTSEAIRCAAGSGRAWCLRSMMRSCGASWPKAATAASRSTARRP